MLRRERDIAHWCEEMKERIFEVIHGMLPVRNAQQVAERKTWLSRVFISAVECTVQQESKYSNGISKETEAVAPNTKLNTMLDDGFFCIAFDVFLKFLM